MAAEVSYVRSVEKRVAELERRVAELEKLLRTLIPDRSDDV